MSWLVSPGETKTFQKGQTHLKSVWVGRGQMLSLRNVAFLLVMTVVAIAASVAGAPMAPPTLVSGGFQTPESILYEPRSDVYLVSNINGDPTASDGNGFISRVAPDGRILELKWIDGAKPGVRLNGPKGMAAAGGTPYRCEITPGRTVGPPT